MNPQSILPISRVTPATRAHFVGCRVVALFRPVIDVDVFVVRAVYDSRATGDDVGGRFFASCETHSTIGPVGSLEHAKDAAFDDYEWCADCAALVDKIELGVAESAPTTSDPNDYSEGDR